MKSSIDLRKTLFNNIYLIGGCANIKNFSKRLNSEMNNLLKLNNIECMNVKVICNKNPTISAWAGGNKVCEYIDHNDDEEQNVIFSRND